MTRQRTKPASARRPWTPGRLGVIAAFVCAIIYFFVPFWWLLTAATKSTEGLYTSPALWFSGEATAVIDNLRRTLEFQDGIFFTWVKNTMVYSFSAGLGATLLALAGGYAFAKFRFRGRKPAFYVLLGTVMIPNTVLVLPTYLLMSQIGLVNTAWAVILPSLLNPLGVYLIRIYAQDSLPNEVLESGRIDGASEMRIFLQLAVPMLRPAIVTVALFSVVATWNNFFLPLVMLSDNDKYPLTVGLNNWRGLATVDGSAGGDLFPMIIMGSLLAIIPLIVVFIAMQRQWQSGLSLGAVKT